MTLRGCSPSLTAHHQDPGDPHRSAARPSGMPRITLRGCPQPHAAVPKARERRRLMDTAHVTVRHVPDDGGSTRRPSSPDLITASLGLLLPGEPMPVRLMNTIWADRHGVYDALTTVSNLAPGWPQSGPATTPPSSRTPVILTGSGRCGTRCAAWPPSSPATLDRRPRRDHRCRPGGRGGQPGRGPGAGLAAAGLPTGPTSAGLAGRASATRRALSSITRDAIDLMTGDTRASVRACHAPGCVLYFVKDHPRREWRSTACGNRARAARHYERHHKTRSSD